MDVYFKGFAVKAACLLVAAVVIAVMAFNAINGFFDAVMYQPNAYDQAQAVIASSQPSSNK